MDLKIKGKKGLVCAASKGLGRATAIALADEGVDLILCARSKDELESVAQEIQKKTGLTPVTVVTDLSIDEDRNKLVDVVNKAGGVDILVHNTGGPKPTSVESTTHADWLEGFNQLFPAVAQLNEAFLPRMKEKKWGRIVCVTSISVLEPISNLAISNAMRSAVTSMLKTLADEVAKDNISVNCVAPGAIWTGRIQNLVRIRREKTGQSEDEYMADYVKPIPAGRLGSPEEFGAVVAFLCSEQASYITGSTICVDGGKRRSTV
ncbi:MAG TPA: SDR family oxidoreductase [Drouetiella sp.]